MNHLRHEGINDIQGRIHRVDGIYVVALLVCGLVQLELLVLAEDHSNLPASLIKVAVNRLLILRVVNNVEIKYLDNIRLYLFFEDNILDGNVSMANRDPVVEVSICKHEEATVHVVSLHVSHMLIA